MEEVVLGAVKLRADEACIKVKDEAHRCCMVGWVPQINSDMSAGVPMGQLLVILKLTCKDVDWTAKGMQVLKVGMHATGGEYFKWRFSFTTMMEVIEEIACMMKSIRP